MSDCMDEFCSQENVTAHAFCVDLSGHEMNVAKTPIVHLGPDTKRD